MNWPPCVSLSMSVWVRRRGYFAFNACRRCRNSPAALHTAVGDIDRAARPNSAWLNRNVKACFATTGYLSGPAKMPLRIDMRGCRTRRTRLSPTRDRPGDIRSIAHRGRTCRWCSIGGWRSASRAHSSRCPPASAPSRSRCWLDVAKQSVGQMQPQQIRERRIGAVKIHARGVGREQGRLVHGIGNAILFERQH